MNSNSRRRTTTATLTVFRAGVLFGGADALLCMDHAVCLAALLDSRDPDTVGCSPRSDRGFFFFLYFFLLWVFGRISRSVQARKLFGVLTTARNPHQHPPDTARRPVVLAACRYRFVRENLSILWSISLAWRTAISARSTIAGAASCREYQGASLFQRFRARR